PAYGSTPACVASRYARYMPQTIMSPWAKFTTRITPKISVSPTAIRLYTPPNSTPLINPCPTSVRSTLHQVEEKHGRSALALDCSTPIPPRQRAWANDEQVGLAQTEIDGEMGCRMGEDDDGPTPSATRGGGRARAGAGDETRTRPPRGPRAGPGWGAARTRERPRWSWSRWPPRSARPRPAR